MEKDKKIGVFDSGIGGLSVLKQLIRFMPAEKFIYLGDTARVPYGNRSQAIVEQYARECALFLLSRDVKMIVVACNTVSSVALDSVIKAAGEIPVVGMIKPAALAAVRTSHNGKIGIIGTRATIGSFAYQNEIRRVDQDEQFTLLAKSCPLFVPFVEEGMINHQSTAIVAGEYLEEFREMNYDSLILGCTHYPLLIRLISKVLPGVQLIDSGEHAAVHALRLLAERGILKEFSDEKYISPDVEFYLTDINEIFERQAEMFLGFSIKQIEKIDLEKILL